MLNTCHPLFSILQEKYPEQVERVFSQNNCDIDATFLGFMDTYKALADLIPQHWTIVDIGCAYAAQAYYFRNHRLYIGTDISYSVTFNFPNTVYWHKSIREVCRNVIGSNLKETFAILNYVPVQDSLQKLVRVTFPNLFCYYPHGESFKPLKGIINDHSIS